MELKLKKIAKFIVILSFVLSVLALRQISFASGIDEYLITEKDGAYLLSHHTESGIVDVGSYSALSLLLYTVEEQGGGRLVFDRVSINENIEFKSHAYTISGNIVLDEGGSVVINGADVDFAHLELKSTSNTAVRIKKGALTVSDSNIYLKRGCAFLLDYDSGAVLNLISGNIVSDTSEPVIRNLTSSVRIYGGDIKNNGGYALYNSSTLLITNNAQIHGGVFTLSPITLSDTSTSFNGELDVYVDTVYKQGSISCLFYSVREPSVIGIRVFDADMEEYGVTYFREHHSIAEMDFGAVYLPFYVDYYVDDSLIYTEELLRGERAVSKSVEQKLGYSFEGWSENGSTLYDFAQPVDSDVDLEAKFTLNPPSFSLSSLEFTYDGASHALALSGLAHPLLDKGIMSYAWYKDGEFISSSPSLGIINTAQNGEYSCEITFAYGTDSAKASTPKVSVNVAKRAVEIPSVPSKEYTSQRIYPDVESNAIYDVLCDGGVESGSYAVKLVLCDPHNYCFFGVGTSEIELVFEITKAQNSWSTFPSVKNIYSGGALNPCAKAKFGEVVYTYSSSLDGQYSNEIPTAAGLYYLKCTVYGCDNYYGIESEPIPFKIYKESVVGITLKTPPVKTEYTAFEHFDFQGAEFTVTYDSGINEIIDGSRLDYSYMQGECFLFGDGVVIASYMGASAAISVEVCRADYVFSEDFAFEDTSVIYNGEKNTVSYTGALPVGLDGSSPSVTVLGGAFNVGSYTVVLEFSVDSKNYNIPESVSAVLTVLPLEVEAVWNNTEHIYDGAPKTPTAYYTDINFRNIPLEIHGTKSLAGEYTAIAVCNDSNYKITNPKADFSIAKANYDMSGVTFGENSFTYNGTEREIQIISGLPDGVRVIGYSDNRATDAGSYFASVVFSYDERNYNPPSLAPFEWYILKAEYDMSDVEFFDSQFVYDGDVHYPRLVGNMPTGLDDSSPTYSFSEGATHVLDGRIDVVISFSTSSKNYNAPTEIIKTIEILPKNISVNWQNTSIFYNGALQAPTAHSDECRVLVLGSGEDAGVYIATAVSADSDYRVLNSTVEFEIKKAPNFWTVAPTVENIFEGGALSPKASAHAGKMRFLYYSGADLSEQIDMPTTVGVYYMVAVCEGDKNYNPIESVPVRFEIIKVTPIALSVELLSSSFVAFDLLASDDLRAYLVNNDGSLADVDFSSLELSYQNGESLRYGDTFVLASYGDYSVNIELNVSKADYDMSHATWVGGDCIYNGQEQSITLTGLPSGVEVLGYVGGVGVLVGEYPARAILSYDGDNYNPPIQPYGELKIRKAIVYPPKVDALVYNGEHQAPSISENELYTVELTSGVSVGEYAIILTLKDGDNYTFKDGEDSITVFYQIQPIKITVAINNADTYIFEREILPSYRVVSGSILEGEELMLVYEIRGERISAYSQNPCYEVTVIDGSITNHFAFSRDGSFVFFIIVLLLFTLILLVLVVVLRKDRIKRYIFTLKYKLAPIQPTVQEAAPMPLSEEPQKRTKRSDDISIPVNVEQADDLISDSLAKSLLRKDEIIIYTYGRKKGIVNVDTLSNSFDSGDKVDINILKQKSLIPYDTGYIKVLARGMIDKSLRVYANDFSLSAIKMIALSGGEALKAVTAPEKETKISKPLEKNPEE